MFVLLPLCRSELLSLGPGLCGEEPVAAAGAATGEVVVMEGLVSMEAAEEVAGTGESKSARLSYPPLREN